MGYPGWGGGGCGVKIKSHPRYLSLSAVVVSLGLYLKIRAYQNAVNTGWGQQGRVLDGDHVSLNNNNKNVNIPLVGTSYVYFIQPL